MTKLNKLFAVTKGFVSKMQQDVTAAELGVKKKLTIIKTAGITTLCCVSGFAMLVGSGVFEYRGGVQNTKIETQTVVQRGFDENSPIFGTEKISAEAIDKYFASVADNGVNKFVGKGKLIYDTAVNQGIEPGVIAAEFAYFTDNGLSSSFQKDNNPAQVMYLEGEGGFTDPVNMDVVIYPSLHDGIVVSSKELSEEYKRFDKEVINDIFKGQFNNDLNTTELLKTLNALYAIQKELNETSKN
ncbi:hypothetical protein bcgnr5372_39030 [Bacillus luti]|nr:hypothetical protein [Bacillus cereus]HDR8337487.1 hypothetical protein [Bacillus cereus]